MHNINETKDSQQQTKFLKIHVVDKATKKIKIFQWPRRISLSELGLTWKPDTADIHLECDVSSFNCILRWIHKRDLSFLNMKNLPGILRTAWDLNAADVLNVSLKFWHKNIKLTVDGEWMGLLEPQILNMFAYFFTNRSLLGKSLLNISKKLTKCKIIIFN